MGGDCKSPGNAFEGSNPSLATGKAPFLKGAFHISSQFLVRCGRLERYSNARRYYPKMIISFADRDTQSLSRGIRVRRFEKIERVAQRKLRQLQIAALLSDLRVPPGNRLEALKGSRQGQHSIRINDQWRICFTWTNSGASGVEIVDYH